MGGEVADVALVFRVGDARDVQCLLANSLVYFMADGKRVRPKASVMSEHIGDASFVVYCNLEGHSRD